MASNLDLHNPNTWGDATRMVRGGLQRSSFDETAEAIFMTSGYVYGSAEEAEAAFNGEKDRFVYSRYGNPTVRMFEERLAAVEGARHAFGTSSGMAAVFAALGCQLSTGDRVVASRALFSSCAFILTDILPRFGVTTDLVDGTDLDQWEAALSTPAKVVFLETPSNPTLEIIDLARVADLAHKAGAKLVVDNVFATPILQKPFQLGADMVIYSATKHIDGQGRCLGGAVLTNDTDWLNDTFIPFVRHTGPALSPFNAWLLLKGLETLGLRVHRQCSSALEVAKALEAEGGVSRVIYPGLESHPDHALAMEQMSKTGGTLVTFDLNGGKEAAFRFLNALKIADISNNLGDSKTLATHPATTTHQRLSEDERARLGISPGTLRLSIGLEDPGDLVADFRAALAAC
ncbi:MAG: O-succinylhomoserine sulfhydrylase [Magnetovibrionaceae bacterium]